MSMRVLVTGGAGFIGSHLVEALQRAGITVAVLDNFSGGKRSNLPLGSTIYEADVCDAARVEVVFRDFRPTHVCHLAAQASVKTSVDNPPLDAQINVIGGLNILEASREIQVERVVFASTGGALYGEVPVGKAAKEDARPRPYSPYAASKAAFESYLDIYRTLYGVPTTVLRYANVYGPRQDPHGEAGVVAIFCQRLLAGKPLRVFAQGVPGDRGCVRDYVYVEDVVAANLLALQGSLEGAFNVSTGVGHTTQDILEGLASILQVTPEITHCKPRTGDLLCSVLDPAKLSAQGWSPTFGLPEGLRRTAEWFREVATLEGSEPHTRLSNVLDD